MARLIQAIAKYGPRLELLETVGEDDASENMARRTGVNKSEVLQMMQEFGEVILDFSRDGRPLKLPGVGTFTPSIDREGMISIHFRPEMDLKEGINARNFFRGKVKNHENIGITDEHLKELWDAENPADPLVI